MVGHVYAVGASRLYTIFVDDDLTWSLKNKALSPRPNVNVAGLKRISIRVPMDWPYLGSYTESLYLYYRAICACGQTNIARSLKGVLSIISQRSSLDMFSGSEDDVVRALLKALSSWAFTRVFSTSHEYMLLVHLHALGGKAPYTKDQIETDISTWVTDNGKGIDYALFGDVLDSVMTTWYRGESGGHLDFHNYCSDVIRWGTSGGAPKSHWDGSEYRTKWAWGLSRTVAEDGRWLNCDVYSDSLLSRTHAAVALKEEPTKTREVIATGMSSYLRQSYLMYRWGKPNLPSPISSGLWLSSFYDDTPLWYGSVDGDRFDQTIPAQVVTDIIFRLGKLDSACEDVAREELDHLSSLTIRWGNNSWRWRGGLLSGWRLTSIIGSIVSHAAAEYVARVTNTVGSLRWGVMGDDLILFSNTTSLTIPEIVDAYRSFGLEANMGKTTSGQVGEFLRKVLHPCGIFGYPALGLRSIVYANPWISSYTYEEELEVSQSWLCFFSRLLPHSICQHTLERFIKCGLIHQLQRFGTTDWDSWISTPISAGGGGCIEWSDMSKWSRLVKTPIHRDPRLVGVWLATTLGITKYKAAVTPIAKLKLFNIRAVEHLKDALVGASANYVPGFDHHINITETVAAFLTGTIDRPELYSRLRYPLPRGLRVAPRRVVVSYLLGLSDEQSGITSIQHTKETCSKYSGLEKYISRGVSISKRFNNLQYVAAAVTLYASQVFGSFMTVYGTW